MRPFHVVEGAGCVLARDNVDTDQIIPARFLRKPRDLSTGGYAPYLFADLKRQDPAFAVAGDCVVLLSGANFGCGSSREGAVYALIDSGVRCVVAPGFGDIFAGNALRNGLLTIVMADAPMLAGKMHVDLERQLIRFADGRESGFTVPESNRSALLEGRDEISQTLAHKAAIADFMAEDARRRPWVQPSR